jgi:uncharacterized membrane protein
MNRSVMLKRTIKIFHEVGSVGVMGALAACIVLVATGPRHSLADYAAVRQGIVAIEKWLLLPSLAIVLISGLLAIMVNPPFMNVGWPWLKALLGISTFEGTLLTVNGSSRQAAELATMALAGQGDPEQLDQALRTEWGGLWIILAVSFANIVIAVWRPRLMRRALP